MRLKSFRIAPSELVSLNLKHGWWLFGTSSSHQHNMSVRMSTIRRRRNPAHVDRISHHEGHPIEGLVLKVLCHDNHILLRTYDL
ncbi:hypothetical protein KC19_9G127400 [Ceratodon purpureus]|uniref:Uncharacterized protein n=1 Tax=Ceratodon purpureus TaxID=3225 RepID=A0A8T0GWW2_CERPU|nr:hypothetical protein KC19_9G127400 [Ceratodon purpureus]